MRACAAARSDEDIAAVHTRLFQHLKSHAKICQDGVNPPAPKIRGGGLLAIGKLDGFLPQGMKGHVVYQFRRDAKASPFSGDDWLRIEFAPDARFSSDIVDDFVPALIRAMNPYLVTVGDQRFDAPFMDAQGRIQVGGPRACGCELHPVFYLSDWRLRQMYQITPEEALAALSPVAQKVSVMQNGLFVVGAPEALDFETAVEHVQRIEQRLHLARPGFFSLLKRLVKRR